MFVWFSLKVLIAATVASAIGQLSKPFTSGKNGGAGAGLDLRTVFRSEGMPSTHSAVKTSDNPPQSLTISFSVSALLANFGDTSSTCLGCCAKL